MTTVACPTVVSICGPAGSGKSQLAKALVAHLGPDHCRVPTDYYLIPARERLLDYFAKPLRYDWEFLTRVLSLPLGTETTTPDFDFDTFQRRADAGGRPFTSRPLMLVDAMEPYPSSAACILIDAPASIRHARIAARDDVWNTRVRERWHNLEIT
jgi:uridine kinase